MQSKIILFLTVLCLAFPAKICAQAYNDTIYNPTVIYSSMPKSYEIAGIEITGAPHYDDSLVLGYAGLKVGDRMTIPGDEISDVAKRLMRQTLFSQARIELVKTDGDKAWIRIVLRTSPRIAAVNYNGVKKSEIKDLQERLNLVKGNTITQNIVNRATMIVKKFYTDKGFGNATVQINLRDYLSNENEVFVDITVDRHDKGKVHKI